MNDNPLVTILSPCYNVEAYLSQCLDSIINQTYRNLQIVLINDGSKDNTWNVMQEYAAKDSRIEIYHQENQGVASTRNNLLDKVKGDYVLFVDSDDWIEVDMVSYLVSALECNNADIAVCQMKRRNMAVSEDDRAELWGRDRFVVEFLKHKRLNGSLCNKLVKTNLFHNVKFHCGIFYGEDALFVWDLLKQVDNIVITNRPLYNYRANPLSLSRVNWTPDRKGTGHYVWETICSDAERSYPQYLDIAYARFALEDMWALYFASLCGYKMDEHIKIRQRNIKAHLPELRKWQLDGRTKYWTANLLSRWYSAGKIFKLLK